MPFFLLAIMMCHVQRWAFHAGIAIAQFLIFLTGSFCQNCCEGALQRCMAAFLHWACQCAEQETANHDASCAKVGILCRPCNCSILDVFDWFLLPKLLHGCATKACGGILAFGHVNAFFLAFHHEASCAKWAFNAGITFTQFCIFLTHFFNNFCSNCASERHVTEMFHGNLSMCCRQYHHGASSSVMQ